MHTGEIFLTCNNFYMFRPNKWPKHVGVTESYRRLLHIKLFHQCEFCWYYYYYILCVTNIFVDSKKEETMTDYMASYPGVRQYFNRLSSPK